jgi:hypothetical protein
MKSIHRYQAALVACLLAGTTACVDGITDINTDPNAPTDVPADFLLPQSIRSIVENTYDGTMMLSHTAIWPQHAVQIQYPDEETGQVRPGNMDGFWATYYAVGLKDIQTVIEKGRAGSRPNHEGVGLIWKSFAFHLVTDLWGDIPYTDALSGEVNTSPAYDAQQQVYVGMLADLRTGVGLLNASGTGFGGGDILYANDFEKWRRFGNSLRMRLAMRLATADAARAQAEFVAAFNAGPFQSNADNAALRWPGAPYENPLHENFLGRDDHGISATMVDTLRSFNDPRLPLYAEPAAADGVYRGLRNGLEKPPLPLASYSRIGSFWRKDGKATPTLLMTYSEVLFLQAEAVQRGWLPGNAGALYTAAIVANMNQYDPWAPARNPSDADIAAYVASPRVTYNPATGLQQIHLQKWISLFMNGNEAFAEWRRTGTPNLVRGANVVTSRIPVRFSYPGSEQSFNGVNLQAAVARQSGGLDLITPVWWMK